MTTARGLPPSRLKPCFDVINSEPPTALDLALDGRLAQFMDKKVPIMSREENVRRERALGEIKGIFLRWVVETCKAKGVSEEVASLGGGEIFTSGSYRLAIHEPGSDIDAHCVTPMYCSRDDFFGTLSKSIKAHPEVTNFNAIETAAVPIITFDFDGVNIDLGLACLLRASVPKGIDIDDDNVLKGVDTATEKCLNGPRVTNMIHRLVPNYDSFLPVVRCVRAWCKARGIYGNKMGYFGGVNVNILVAFVCQLYPCASPSRLLSRFFKVMRSWSWPNPVYLVKPFDADLGLEFWHASMNPWHIMPIITPAYPCMNSSVSVSPHSLAVIKEEFVRGDEICCKAIEAAGKGEWDTVDSLYLSLIEPSDFFIKYPHYVAIDIMAGNEGAFRTWDGYMQSRLRKLLDSFNAMRLPMSHLHLFPRVFNKCCGGGIGGELPAYCHCLFTGFNVDRARMQGSILNLSVAFSKFEEQTARPPFRKDGMHISLTHFGYKDLPRWVFDSLGGKASALLKRKKVHTEQSAAKRRRLQEINAAAESQLSARKLQKPPISTTKVEQEDHALKDEEELLKPDELRSEGQHKTVAAGRRKRGTKVIGLVNLGPIIPPWRKELLNKAQDKARSIRVEFKPEAVET